jgi:hypothetical protein
MAFTDRVFYRTGAARKSGIWTTTTSSHLSGPGATPITITVADASLFPRGAGDSEDCLLSVCSSENQNTVLDILYDVAISGNSVTCKREYGNAIPEGSIMLVGAPAELLDELKTELSGKEDSFGNPTSDGGVLTSTTGGVRSWVGKDTLPPFLRSEADYIVAASGGDYTTITALLAAVTEQVLSTSKIWVQGTISESAAVIIYTGHWHWDGATFDYGASTQRLIIRGNAKMTGEMTLTGGGLATSGQILAIADMPDLSDLVIYIDHIAATYSDANLGIAALNNHGGGAHVVLRSMTGDYSTKNVTGILISMGAQTENTRVFVRSSVTGSGSPNRYAIETSTACRRCFPYVGVDSGLTGWTVGLYAQDLETAASGGANSIYVSGFILSGTTKVTDLTSGSSTVAVRTS